MPKHYFPEAPSIHLTFENTHLPVTMCIGSVSTVHVHFEYCFAALVIL